MKEGHFETKTLGKAICRRHHWDFFGCFFFLCAWIQLSWKFGLPQSASPYNESIMLCGMFFLSCLSCHLHHLLVSVKPIPHSLTLESLCWNTSIHTMWMLSLCLYAGSVLYCFFMVAVSSVGHGWWCSGLHCFLVDLVQNRHLVLRFLNHRFILKICSSHEYFMDLVGPLSRHAC